MGGHSGVGMTGMIAGMIVGAVVASDDGCMVSMGLTVDMVAVAGVADQVALTRLEPGKSQQVSQAESEAREGSGVQAAMDSTVTVPSRAGRW